LNGCLLVAERLNCLVLSRRESILGVPKKHLNHVPLVDRHDSRLCLKYLNFPSSKATSHEMARIACLDYVESVRRHASSKTVLNISVEVFCLNELKCRFDDVCESRYNNDIP